MADFPTAFGLLATVLIVTALASGFIQRSPLRFPLMFLTLGLVLGQNGLGFITVSPHDPILEVVATLTLCLVLFLDALQIQIKELGKRWLVPALILGPGTALIITLGALPLALILGFTWTVAFIGGAVLASTDPVILREILQDERIPRPVRQILKIEAGTNDLVVLPIILILIAVAQSEIGSPLGWTDFLFRLLVLGPAVGFIIGGLGSWLMAKSNERLGVKRVYQALFGLGLVLASYSAATALGGDGFLAAFFAGLAVTLLNQTLSNDFLDYGEVSAEMAMMVAFILFGAVLSGMLTASYIWPALLLAVLVIFIIRPSVVGVVLARLRMRWEAHFLVGWFGPRGLNSLLLALLVVQANLVESEALLATVGVVVLASAAIHGASVAPLAGWYANRTAKEADKKKR